MMVVADAVLAGTRETLGALTVSALHQTRAMIHRVEPVVEECFQAGSNDESNSVTSWRA